MQNRKVTIFSMLFTLSDLFMLLFFLLTFVLTSISNTTSIYQLRFLLLIAAGGLGFLQLFNKMIMNNEIVFFVVICISSWILTLVFRGDGAYDSNLFLYSLFYMGMGINLVSHKRNYVYSTFLFYLVSGFFLFKIVVLNEPIREILIDNTSYNFISVILLLVLSCCCIDLCQNNKKIPYNIAAVFSIVSLLTYGRGGMISGLFFLVSIIFLGAKDSTNIKNANVFFRTLMLVIGFFAIYLYLGRAGDEILLTLFAKFLINDNLDDSRLDIWNCYLNDAFESISAVVFGVDPYRVFDGGNLHNAFLQMHSALGLIPFLLLIYSFVNIVVYLYKKRQMYLLCVLLTIALRSMTDKTAFQGYCEPLFYYVIFSWFNVRRKKRLISYCNVRE